jgi:altronate hydrolase
MLQASPAAIRLNPNDDVMIACRELATGTQLPGTGVRCTDVIPSGHKVAVNALAQGAPVRRYNQIIGFATQEIKPGQHVHVHNLAMGDFERDYAYGTDLRPVDYITPQATFDAIVRKDGRVATRNYIGVLSTVNCSATVTRAVSDYFKRNDVLKDYPNVDGIVGLTHSSGCGMGSSGLGIDVLRRSIAGYAKHPNFAGIVLVGLGCEANQMSALTFTQKLKEGEKLYTMTIQDKGGTKKTLDAAIAAVKEMLPEANDIAPRQKMPASHLILGLECGGSDGYSGITANPALGAAADLLVRHGGTAILSETPEVYGAEHLLTRRAVSKEVGEKLIERIKWWEDYTARNDGDMDNNPSPGNKAGGLTTILEKSLGAVAKGGTMPMVDVYQYGEPVSAKGFVFMDTPGYDPCSVVGHVAGGANIVCFTTGRGSAFGCKPTPSLKLSTNTPMYQRMTDDMDINCGEVVDGTASVQELGERIFKLILDTASGKRSKSEELGYGEEEFTPWILGATM